MELVRRFPRELLAQALADWAWMPQLADKAPIFASSFGDLFLQSQDGSWFLDTLEGTLTRVCDNPQVLEAQLNTPEGQDKFLMAGLAIAAHESGLVPGDGEVLSFKVPPVLGGQLDTANIEVSDLVVALSLLGQIHQQIKELPPGTPVSEVTIK